MSITGNEAITIEWLFVGLAACFVALRCYVRMVRQKTFNHPGDYLVIIALLFFAACCACDTVTNQLGLMQPDMTYSKDLTTVNPDRKQAQMVLKLLYFSALPYYTELWIIKVALLLFYYSIIPVNMRGHRIALHVVSATVAVSFVCVLLINAFACLPVHRNWSLDGGKICFSYTKLNVFLFSVSCNVITDLMIFSLPFPLLPTLKLVKRSQLYGLIFIFGLGFLCIVASVSRCIALARRATVTEVAVWTAAECSIGLMVACSPALRVLVRNRRWRGGYTSKSRSENKSSNAKGGTGVNTIGGSDRTGRQSRGNALDAWSRLEDEEIGPEPKSVVRSGGDSNNGGGGSRITTANSSTTKIDETNEVVMRDLDPAKQNQATFFHDIEDEERQSNGSSSLSLARGPREVIHAV